MDNLMPSMANSVARVKALEVLRLQLEKDWGFENFEYRDLIWSKAMLHGSAEPDLVTYWYREFASVIPSGTLT